MTEKSIQSEIQTEITTFDELVEEIGFGRAVVACCDKFSVDDWAKMSFEQLELVYLASEVGSDFAASVLVLMERKASTLERCMSLWLLLNFGGADAERIRKIERKLATKISKIDSFDAALKKISKFPRDSEPFSLLAEKLPELASSSRELAIALSWLPNSVSKEGTRKCLSNKIVKG